VGAAEAAGARPRELPEERTPEMVARAGRSRAGAAACSSQVAAVAEVAAARSSAAEEVAVVEAVVEVEAVVQPPVGATAVIPRAAEVAVRLSGVAVAVAARPSAAGAGCRLRIGRSSCSPPQPRR
jgi:hypothetical protein